MSIVFNSALRENSSDKESNRQNEGPTWSQSRRNKDDKESNPGTSQGKQGEQIELLTFCKRHRNNKHEQQAALVRQE